MADIINPDKTVMTHNADVYWHYAGDPVQRSQLLGTFTIGTPQKVLLPIPTDADIVLRAVPRGGRGQTFMAGPADATPVTVSALGVGTGGGTSNFYQQLKVNHGYSYGTTPTPRPILNLLQSFQIKDDAVFGESDLTTFGVPTGQLNLKTDFNASGQIAVTTATWAGTGSDIVLATTLELQPGQGIFVKGAGVSGSDLVTTCSVVSADGKTITLASGPFTAGPYTIVQADDTAAVQGWLNAKGDLAMPPGYYRLTSSITMPTTSEGFSIVIHGSGWDQSQFVFQHGGDGFVPTGDLRMDSVVFCDLTVATGTKGDASGTIDANSRGIGIRWTSPGYTGIYDNFVMQRCRVIGWGRWGLWSDNLEVSWISQCIFRENKSGHCAFVGPDTISPNKQPNANTITDSTFDQAISAGPSDSKRTVTGSMTAGSRTLSGSGFTANDRGKFVIVHGAATGGGDLYSFVDVFNSSSNVTLAHQAQFSASGTLEVFPVNVASILLNRANDTVLDGSTIQGNYADAGSGATNVLSDVNAIKCYNSANCRFIGIHEEDNAGPGGAAIRMENCIAMTIENWGGTSAGPPDFVNAHRSDFELINCHCVSVKNSFFNDRPQFVIDSTSSEIQIDDSFIVGYINLWQQDNSWDRLRIGSGVRVYQAADPRTNQVAGNEYSYDGFFGRNLLVNGRFLDGSDGFEGWTKANPTWFSLTTNSQTRGGLFLNVNATTQADSGTPATILHQTISIPDTTNPGLFILGFDWNLDLQNGVEQAGRFVEVRLHPSSGIDEAQQFSTRRFAVVQDTWQVGHIRCFLGSGTGRTIDVQINVTPGPNNVIIHFANFRLAAGKHIYGAWEQGIHDFGGRMHAPLEYASLPTTGTGSVQPPPIGATYMSMVNDAGTLKVGYNGVWSTVAAGAGGGAVIAGTPNRFAMFNSPSGNNVVNAPVEYAFGQVHFILAGAWLDRTLPLVSVFGTGNTAHLAMVDTDDVVYFGPKFDTAGTSTGALVLIRSGSGTLPRGRLWVDGTNGKLTFNDTFSNTYNSAVFVRIPVNTMNGITLATQAGAYSGQFFLQCMSTTLDVVQFAVDSGGDITRIKHRDYIWPTTTPVTTGTTPNVLGYSGQTTANAPVTLQWIPMASGGGSIPPGTANRIVKYDAAGTSITNAPAEDAGTEFHIMAVGLRVDNNRVINSLYAVGNYCELATIGSDNIVRFGPANDSAGGSVGTIVLIRSGAGATNQGRLWINGTNNGKLTFNDDYLNNDTSKSWGASAFHLRINGTATHGITFQTPNSYTGRFLQVLQGTLNLEKFVVAFDGDLTFIRGKAYHWPTVNNVANTWLHNDGAGNLTWDAVSGGGGGGVSGNGNTNYLTRWTSTAIPGTLQDSGIEDQGSGVTGNLVFHRGFLLGHSDGYTNMGTTSNRFATFYCRAVNMSSVLGTGGSVASAGWIDAAVGEVNRWWHNGTAAATQTGNGQRLQTYSYHGIELRGNRRSASPPGFTTISGTDSSGVLVYQETDVVPLVINTAINITSDLFTIQNVGANKFRVATLGTTWMDGGIRNNLFNNIAATAGGQTFDLANYFNYYTLIFDSGVAAFTFTLPLLTAAWHGFRYRLICRNRASANQVTIRCASGNDINESGIGGTTGIAMTPNLAGKRDAILVADYNNSQWWLGFAAN